MARASWQWWGAPLCATALVVAGCKDPTEITFVLATDVPCDRVTGVSIAVGSPQDVDTRGAATTTHSCVGAGDLGTIVTVPTDSKTDAMSIVVTLGVGRDPIECQPPNFGTGCITARRSLHYIPHTPLRLGVDLRAACNGVLCSGTDTCVAGACTSATVSDPSACKVNCGEAALAAGHGGLQVPSPLVCGDMSGLQPGAVWPMLGYCPTRVGRSPRVGAQTAGVRWTAPVGAPIQSGITISADGTIYFGASDSKLYAVSPAGLVKWSSRVGSSFGETVGAIGRDGTIYMGNDDQSVYAFDPGGGVKWTYKIGGRVRTSPNIGGDGTIFVGGGDGQHDVFALVPNGTLRWQFPTNGDIWSSPTIGIDGRIYFGSEDQHLYALQPDGSVRWSPAEENGLQTPIVGDDGWLYFSGKPSLCAVDANSTLQWKTSTDGDATTPALGADGAVYTGSTAGTFYAFDSHPGNKGGHVRWQLSLTPFDTWNQPIIGADGTIYIGATDGTFYALTRDGAVKWRLPTGGAIHGAAAMGADGTIYFGNDEGKLYAVGP